MQREVSMYKDYLIAQHDPKVSVDSVMEKYHINRNSFYAFLRRIDSGNVKRVEQELRKARLDVLWEYRYMIRFKALPRNRRPGNITKIREIINDMVGEGFPIADIARRFGKHHTTIMHQLEK